MSRAIFRFSLALTLIVGSMATPASVRAASFNVDSTADAIDVNPGDGICDADSVVAGAQCTLRAAIMEANQVPGVLHEIQLLDATYTLTIAGTGEDAAATGDLDILGAVRIAGFNALQTHIDGNAKDRVFDVRPGGKLILSDLSVENGVSPVSEAGGGAIRSDQGERSQLIRVDIADNLANGDGGGLASSATQWDILDTTFTRNRASSGRGGAIANDGAAMVFEGASIVDNRASGSGSLGAGGGIYSLGTSTLRLTNSTLSGNVAATDGGALVHSSSGTAVLRHVTVVDNEASTGDGGGIHHMLGSTTLVMGDSVLAFNRAPAGSGPNCFSNIQSLGNNLLADTAGCSLSAGAAGDITGVDPRLAPLRNNGGATDTHAPLVASVLLDAGDAGCVDALGRSLHLDQRGDARPESSDGQNAAACDLGAVELAAAENNVVVDCLDGTAQESISRGFYIENYAADALGTVEVNFTPEVAGEHRVRLTLRDGSYDGPALSSLAKTFTLPSADPISYGFILNGLAGKTVAFVLEAESLPVGATDLFYDAGLCDDPNVCAFCPDLFQTTDTSTPLSTVLRAGAGVRILTAVPEPATPLLQGVALMSLLMMAGGFRRM